MLFHLVKKDFLLVKKYALFMVLVAIALPFFMIWRTPMFAGQVSFLFTVFFVEFILCQYVSQIESKYPKAGALLCAAPYSRSSIVKAKYAFFLFVFTFCFIVYSALAMTVPPIRTLDLPEILLILLIVAIPFGVYVPLEFKFGYEKTKFAAMIILSGLSFGLPTLYMSNVKIDLSVWETIPVIVQCLLLAVSAMAVLGLSMLTSAKIYDKKEL